MATDDLHIISGFCKRGDIQALEQARLVLEGFPQGAEPLPGEPWIRVAVGIGNPAAVAWMLAQKVALNMRGDDGYTLFDVCLELQVPARHDILALLIEAGADVNLHGSQDWTPLHRAALLEDRRAMQMLMDAGADRTRRIRIDDCTTPEEEARQLVRPEAADFIRDYQS